MRILFVMLHPGYVRNYESAIRLLASRGHHVHLAFNQPFKQVDDELAQRVAREFPNVSFGSAPKRPDFWRFVAAAIRMGVDFARYLHPKYERAPKLVERVGFRLRRNVEMPVQRLRGVAGKVTMNRLIGFLSGLEAAVPSSDRVEDFITALRADVVLITPMVSFGSDQVEFAKSARKLGLSSAVCVASWDNLTNKGLIRVDPDLVLVWNDVQKAEAVEMHGIPPSRIVVTGAQCYDKWFDQRPGTTRDEFASRVGLDPARPFVLYTCSSPFIAAGREVGFVEKWIRCLRASGHPGLADVGVLVRPHPQNAGPWKKVDFSGFGNVAIYPRAGANPVLEDTKADFYDSIYHSAAVVGVNTSAMIEAGIVGRPVLTVLAPEFSGTQEGTLHFHYLVQGGLLRTGNSLEEHVGQLAEVLRGPADTERLREFIRSFVRPRGLDAPCTPVFADAVESLQARPPLPRSRAPLWAIVLKPFMIFAGFLLGLNFQVKAGETGLKLVRWMLAPLWRLARRVLKLTLRVARVLFRWLRLERLVREQVVPLIRDEFREPGKQEGREDPYRALKKQARRAAESGRPLIVGPWISEVGFEILYWIPFLRWCKERYSIPAERMVVVSRGGTAKWYEGICGRYYDIFDYFTPEEFRQRNERRIRKAGGQKHLEVGEFDRAVIKIVKRKLGLEEAGCLHPMMMYQMFLPFWRGRMPIRHVQDHTRFEPLKKWDDGQALPGLPREYVAAKFYFSASFPDNAPNRAAMRKVLEGLAARSPVVLLNTGLKVDDHGECEDVAGDSIHTVEDCIVPTRNLEMQSRIISRARAFVGTYGGFSYIAPLFGVPTLALYSGADSFLQVHLDVARRAYASSEAGYGSFATLDVRDLDLIGQMFPGAPFERWSGAEQALSQRRTPS